MLLFSCIMFIVKQHYLHETLKMIPTISLPVKSLCEDVKPKNQDLMF